MVDDFGYFGGKHCQTAAENKIIEALKFALTIFAVNIILDALIYCLVFEGYDYFAFLSIWFVYAMFIAIPYWTAKRGIPLMPRRDDRK